MRNDGYSPAKFNSEVLSLVASIPRRFKAQQPLPLARTGIRCRTAFRHLEYLVYLHERAANRPVPPSHSSGGTAYRNIDPRDGSSGIAWKKVSIAAGSR